MIGEKIEEETRYFISSLLMGAKKVAEAIREHLSTAVGDVGAIRMWMPEWVHVENSLHWVLDRVFLED